MGKGIRELWGKGFGKWMRGGDCGERDEGRGLWRKGCEKGMRRGDCAEGDEGSG